MNCLELIVKKLCSTYRRLSREHPWGESLILKLQSPKRNESKKKKIEAKLRKINFIGEVMTVAAQFRDKN